MKELYLESSLESSKIITRKYSTSFSLGIMMLDKKLHEHIYSIYGFVRLADEIVDTFHEYPQEHLLEEFKKDTYEAIEKGISMNPVLHSFQRTVNMFNIKPEHIDAFLNSMEMDLRNIKYDDDKFEEYILGSAQVVGLMCLQVFLGGNEKSYNELEPHAKSLGSAFQKVNFLRDLREDMKNLGRSYFPNVELNELDSESKLLIEKDIEKDFNHALEGIKKLPESSKFGVYTAYLYYLNLLKKIRNSDISQLMNNRIRVSNFQKFLLLLKSKIKITINKL